MNNPLTGHGEFEPTPERGSMNGGDHRLGTILDASQARVHRTRALERSVTSGNGLEKTDIRSRNEGCARTDQHDRAHRGIFSGTLDGGFDGFRDARAEGIYRGLSTVRTAT